MARGRKKKKPRLWAILLTAALLVVVFLEGRFYIPKIIRPPRGLKPQTVEMKTTAYCHCRRCCSYQWFLFFPYQKRGPFSFRLKHVGVTSSGALARPGTIAADTSLYPHGTIMHIPGYGYARVEDTGGAIKGQHIDLYRPNHWTARAWGVRKKRVKVWLLPRTVQEPESILRLNPEPKEELAGKPQTNSVPDLESIPAPPNADVLIAE